MNGRRMRAGTVALLALGILAACGAGTDATPEAEAAVLSPVNDVQAASTGGQVSDAEEVEIVTVDETGSTSIDEAALVTVVAPYPADELTADEVAALLYMREEEKLAHDVYATLYELWGTPIFQNIADSEQTHTEAVKTLIERYGLEDPAANNGVGVFTDPDLQALHDQLVATGSESLSSALRVGAAIEEIDILDLEESIAGTDNEDISLVYENLMKGSRNHLRSFVATLERQTGEIYRPQYLDQATYDDIISTGIEKGGRGRS